VADDNLRTALTAARSADTHKDVYVAVVLDRLGRHLAVQKFPATDAGNCQLAQWLAGLGPAA
jgi:hypothetical protein